MNRMKRATTVALGLATLGLLAGCSQGTTAEESKDPKVWGYIASADSARIDLAEDQLGVTELVVKSVTAPEDAWIVVHLDDGGKPGARIGLAAIPKGESTDVKVELDEVTSPKVIVAVHADRGVDDEFDFDMMAKETSPDRPFFVDGAEVAKVATVREFGVKADEGAAAIEVADQPGAKDALTVARAVAPTGAWVVVHLDDEGAPGARVGLAHIPAGESTDVAVELYPVPLTDTLFVAVHADRGEADLFEFDMMDKLNSPDQPFFVGDEEVATSVKVK